MTSACFLFGANRHPAARVGVLLSIVPMLLGGTATHVADATSPALRGNPQGSVAVAAAFRATKFDKVAEERADDPRLAQLPFVLEIIEPFRLASLNGNLGVLLTVGPKDIDPEASQPQIIVTYTETAAPIDDLETYAKTIMNTIGDSVMIDGQEEAAFADLDGIASHGRFSENGLRKRFMQVVAATQSGALIQFLGTATEDKYPELADVMEGVAASITIDD